MGQPASTRLSKEDLIRKPWEYQIVYQKGKRLRGNNFTLIYTENGRTKSRLGISVHGFKKAVKRNRVKRIIREYYRFNRQAIYKILTGEEAGPAVDIIFAVRKQFSCTTLAEIGLTMAHLNRRH